MRARRAMVAALVGSAMAVASGLPVASAAPAARAATPRDPVIIVAGTFAGQGLSTIYYAPLAARLRAEGHRVEIFGLPGSGLGDIAVTAQKLNTYADSVRAQTGAARVDLIGHSQGGLVSRHYVRYGGGANEVDSIISLAAPHYGTAVANIARLLGLGNCIGVVSCNQMAIGSSFLNDLNRGDITVGSVSYTNFSTVGDGIVIPYTNALMNDSSTANTNVRIQSQCPFRAVGHVSIALDGTVYSGVQDALAHRSIRLNCFAV